MLPRPPSSPVPRHNPTIRVWLGGSFDPVHQGHVTMLQQVYARLQRTFPTYPIVASFLPTAGSPLKQRPTSAADRMAMLQLAIAALPHLSVDTSELSRSAPVYTFDTLHEFWQRYPDDIRIFVMGADSALGLTHWYRGLRLIELAHLWVIPRPTVIAPAAIDKLSDSNAIYDKLDPSLQPFVTFALTDLINRHPNHIYIDNQPPPAWASRAIRHWLHEPTAHHALLQAALPQGVMGYIMQQQLYQPSEQNNAKMLNQPR